MNIGVIGTGQIGEVIIRRLRGAGYSVTMATSRGYRAVENADYQPRADAFRSLFNEQMKQ
jgi:predicted dinucleotide-binding enzyme